MSFDWKGVLGGIAPALASALGGPAAGKAVAIIGAKLLGKDNATVDEVAAAVANATPEQIESLRKLEQEFVLSLVDKAAVMEKVEADDRANARQLQKDRPSHTPAVITYVVLILFAAALILGYFVTVPPSNQLAINAMVEVLKLLNVTAFGFWLGSSSSGRAKDAVISKIAHAK